MDTSPLTVAEMIRKGAEAVGATVTYSNADTMGRFGVMHVTMPDGAVTTIKIELEF